MKYYLFQQGDLGEHCKLPQWGPVWSPGSKALLGFTYPQIFQRRLKIYYLVDQFVVNFLIAIISNRGRAPKAKAFLVLHNLKSFKGV